MITDLIVTAFLAGLDAILSLFPNLTFPASGGTALATAAGNMNTVFPIFLVITLAATVIGIRLLINGFDLAVFVYHQFWGSS